MQINAWRVQLHELSQSEHTHVSTMQPVTSWTIGASKEVTFTCSGQKPKVTFHSFILLMPYTSKHQQVLSALPPKYTQNSTCSHHLQASHYLTVSLHCFQPGLLLLSPACSLILLLLPAVSSPHSSWRGLFNMGIA